MRSLPSVSLFVALIAALAGSAESLAQDRYANPPAPNNYGDLFKEVPSDSRYGGSPGAAPQPNANPLRSATPPAGSSMGPTSPATRPPMQPGGGSTFSSNPPAQQRSAAPPANPFAELARPSSSLSTSPPTTPRQPVSGATMAPNPNAPSESFQPRALATTPPATPPRQTLGVTPSQQPPARAFSSDLPRDPYARNQPPVTPQRSMPPAVGFADLGAREGTNTAVSAEREAQTRRMLEAMLRAPQGSQLNGNPTSLGSVLAGAGTRESQSVRTEAYWALSSTVADYYLGLSEVQELQRLRQRVPTYSQTLSEAQANLAARVQASYRAARAAQLRLGRATGGDSRVLPTDIPFCGPYATRYSEIFAGGAPEEARLLDELLPMRLAELMDAARAVERSEKWIEKVAADQSAGSDGTGMVRALELLALNRRAFVQIARDYNLQISRYAQLATPGNVDTGRLVAMLIRTQGAGSFTAGQPSGLEFRPGTVGARR